MKKSTLLKSALSIALVTAIIFSCKKKEEAKPEEATPTTTGTTTGTTGSTTGTTSGTLTATSSNTIAISNSGIPTTTFSLIAVSSSTANYTLGNPYTNNSANTSYSSFATISAVTNGTVPVNGIITVSTGSVSNTLGGINAVLSAAFATANSYPSGSYAADASQTFTASVVNGKQRIQFENLLFRNLTTSTITLNMSADYTRP